ncbi:RICIN domain-containing protein [Kitasatospora sp. NPDC057015]|uniref:RICIN domain-containing protein n=1 Tax=Kitasatospora sp. NPDC057015 TaxID=3346001 RepID=UPI00362CEF59
MTARIQTKATPLVLAAAAMLSVLVGVQPAAADPNGQYIVNKYDTNIVVDVSGGRPVAGQWAIAYAKNGGDNQKWSVHDYANGLAYQVGPGVVLARNSSTGFVESQFDSGQPGQRWWMAGSSSSGFVYLHSRDGNDCLTNVGTGSQLITARCRQGDPRQLWAFR